MHSKNSKFQWITIESLSANFYILSTISFFHDLIKVRVRYYGRKNFTQPFPFIGFASTLNISNACNSEALRIKLWTRISSIDSYLRFQKIIFKILLINMLIGFKKIFISRSVDQNSVLYYWFDVN